MSEKKTKETIAKEEIEEQELKSVAGGADEGTNENDNEPAPEPTARFRF